MNRYVATETGKMLKCEQGAWVKHDDYVILERRILRLEEELKRERELNGEKSVLIDELREKLREFIKLDVRYCKFCGDFYEPKDDREYIRLIGGWEK